MVFNKLMKSANKNIVREFVEACRGIAARGLVRCSSGNLSLRLDDKRMLVKASRSWFETMSPGDVSVCRVSDGALIEGRKPTVEIGFHAGIMRARPDVNAVLHFQSPFATALACRGGPRVNYFVIPEIPFYIGRIAHVPFLPPGSRELADAVVAAMRRRDMAVMANHGQVAVASDLEHAAQNAEFFELACEIIVRCGKALKPLPKREAEALLKLRAQGSGFGAA